ncbi:MAG: transglycosylase family protein [Acidimicrobiia bacterium]
MTRAITLSPARAQPHDATAWFPVPDPRALPSIDALLHAASTQSADSSAPIEAVAIDLASLEALVSPTPARAAPHDPAAWLPLPADLDQLPGVSALLEPPPEVTMAVVAAAEAVVADAAAAAEAAVAPSPARAEPHDSAAWLPLPDPDSLVPLSSMSPLDGGVVNRPAARQRLGSAVRRPRAWVLVVLIAATVLTAVRITGDSTPSAVAGVAPFRVTVDLDGTTSIVSTTVHHAPALGRQLGVGKLVAVRTSPTRLTQGSSVVFRTRKSGQLQVDGQTVPYDSPSLTVAELLAVSHVVLDGEDTSIPSPDTVLTDGTRVEVVRVGTETRQTTAPVAFGTEMVADPTIAIGQTREIRDGSQGLETITWRARVENGEEVGQTMLSQVTTVAPVSHLVGYGTKADWHWDALAQCETGGRWGTIDPAGAQGYDGGLGIYRPNWIHYGGLEFAANAGLATREEQIIVAQRIFNDYGWSAWGCARNTLNWA